MKTTDQLVPDSLRFATFDAGCRLQMALGVKRERKKRNDGGKDYSGNPETAQVHESHDVIQDRRQLRTFPFSTGTDGLQTPMGVRGVIGLCSGTEEPSFPARTYPAQLNRPKFFLFRALRGQI